MLSREAAEDADALVRSTSRRRSITAARIHTCKLEETTRNRVASLEAKLEAKTSEVRAACERADVADGRLNVAGVSFVASRPRWAARRRNVGPRARRGGARARLAALESRVASLTEEANARRDELDAVEAKGVRTGVELVSVTAAASAAKNDLEAARAGRPRRAAKSTRFARSSSATRRSSRLNATSRKPRRMRNRSRRFVWSWPSAQTRARDARGTARRRAFVARILDGVVGGGARRRSRRDGRDSR